MNRAWLLLALFGLLVIVGAVGYREGHKAATTAAEAAQAGHLRRAIAQAEAIAAQDREILAAGDARAARVRRVFQTIDREVIRYAQIHPLAADCLDADGRLLWSAANAGDFPPGAGDGAQPGRLPGQPAGADGRDGAGPAGGSRRPGEAVPRAAHGGGDVGGVDAGAAAWGKPPHWGWR